MRKISKQIATAFLKGHRAKASNTATDGQAVYLHGNMIAERRKDGVWMTLSGWGTVTTRERLNTIADAMGSEWGFCQRNGIQYLCRWNRDKQELVAISPYEWVKITESGRFNSAPQSEARS